MLGTFNGKRYDARILCFRNHDAGIQWPKACYHVDFRDVFPDFFALHHHKRLEDYHKAACGGKSIKDAHSALGDCFALHNIIDSCDEKEMSDSIEEHVESIHKIQKRCGLR